MRGQSETQSDNDRNTPFRAAPATSDPSPLRRTMCTAEMGLAPLDLDHLDEPPPKDAVGRFRPFAGRAEPTESALPLCATLGVRFCSRRISDDPRDSR